MTAPAQQVLDALKDIADHNQPPFISEKWQNYTRELAQQAIPAAQKLVEMEREPSQPVDRSLVEKVEGVIRYLKAMANTDGNPDASADMMIAEELEEALRELPMREPSHLAKRQPCGCVVCTCETDDQCSGCGAKHCGKHPVGEFPEGGVWTFSNDIEGGDA